MDGLEKNDSGRRPADSVPNLRPDQYWGSNETLISLDDYLANALPLHLQQLFLENLQKRQQEVFDNASGTLIDAVNDSSLQQLQRGLSLSYDAKHSSFSSLSFAQGLLLGQLSVILVLIFFIKFFVFSEGHLNPEGPKGTKSSSINDSEYTASPLISASASHFLSSIIKRGGKDGPDISEDTDNDRRFSQINAILEKTYYNVETHAPESLDWFNVLIAQTIQQFREEASFTKRQHSSFSQRLHFKKV